jgi:hypothetical protein
VGGGFGAKLPLGATDLIGNVLYVFLIDRFVAGFKANTALLRPPLNKPAVQARPITHCGDVIGVECRPNHAQLCIIRPNNAQL